MTALLVDTSVWVDHFRRRNDELVRWLLQDAVLIHPWVLGELACGTPPARVQTLADLAALQQAKVVTVDEVMTFGEREQLYGLGFGLVDLGLLASTLITPGARLWTLDKRLASLAERLGVAHPSGVH
jgi:predicted nucleic acid-binding protein